VARPASIVFALEVLGMFGGVRFSIAAAEALAMRPEMAREAKNFIMGENRGPRSCCLRGRCW
jgi:hypothetical protein